MDKDTALIKKHLSGDVQATQALVEKYQNLVYALAWQMLRDREDVSDAAQEIFLNVLGALPQFRGECAFSTWLYRIAVNVCISKSKQKKRRAATEISIDAQVDDLPENHQPSFLAVIEQEERDNCLHQAVAELAEPYRVVIVLHYFQELAYEEIAQIINVPLGTVKVRLFRAKTLLQRKLKTLSNHEERV